MIHYILSNPILSIIIGFVLAILIFVILGIITLALAHIAKNKTPVKIGLITLLLTFIVPLIVALTPIVIYMSSTTEVQYGEWKEIYTNELDADVKLKLHSPI